MDVPNNHYPTTEQFLSVQAAVRFVPELLQTSLKDLIAGKDIKLKLASSKRSSKLQDRGASSPRCS